MAKRHLLNDHLICSDGNVPVNLEKLLKISPIFKELVNEKNGLGKSDLELKLNGQLITMETCKLFLQLIYPGKMATDIKYHLTKFIFVRGDPVLESVKINPQFIDIVMLVHQYECDNQRVIKRLLNIMKYNGYSINFLNQCLKYCDDWSENFLRIFQCNLELYTTYKHIPLFEKLLSTFLTVVANEISDYLHYLDKLHKSTLNGTSNGCNMTLELKAKLYQLIFENIVNKLPTEYKSMVYAKLFSRA